MQLLSGGPLGLGPILMWIVISLVTAATLAVVNLADKRLLDRHLPSLDCLYAWVAFALLAYIAVAVVVFGIPSNAATPYVFAALASGLTLGIGYALLFVALKVDEASRAVAISQVYPIVVAILAVPLLGEQLNTFQWAAILLVVLGTILISLPVSPNGLVTPGLSRGVPASVASGLFIGVGIFAAKVALDESPFMTVFIFQQLGTLLAFLPFCRPRVCVQLVKAMRNPETMTLLLVGEGLLPVVVVGGALLATKLGPVSLVSAFLATTPMFVFVLATTLSQRRWQLMQEAIHRQALALKLAAITMIVSGVSVLGLL